MEKGDKVKLVRNGVMEKFGLKKEGVYTIEYIKPSGGLILKEVEHTYSIFGEIQGLMKNRFKLVKNK